MELDAGGSINDMFERNLEKMILFPTLLDAFSTRGLTWSSFVCPVQKCFHANIGNETYLNENIETKIEPLLSSRSTPSSVSDSL